MKKNKKNVSEKDLSDIFKQALDMIEKLDDNLEDLVEFSCNLKLLLRKVKNKMTSGIENESTSTIALTPPSKPKPVSLEELIILDADDMDLLDGSEEL